MRPGLRMAAFLATVLAPGLAAADGFYAVIRSSPLQPVGWVFAVLALVLLTVGYLELNGAIERNDRGSLVWMYASLALALTAMARVLLFGGLVSIEVMRWG